MPAAAVLRGLNIAMNNAKYSKVFSEREKRMVEYFCQNILYKPVTGLKDALPKDNPMITFFAADRATQNIMLNKLVSPGYSIHKAARKLLVKQTIEDVIAKVDQVVFLGGGYDVRGFLTAQDNKGIRVFEIDRASTLNKKIEAIKSMPSDIFPTERMVIDHPITTNPDVTRINNNLFLIEADLSNQSLQRTLETAWFNPHKPSLFVVEGVTMYLEEKELRQLLKSVQLLLCEGDSCVISFRSSMNSTVEAEKIQASSDEAYYFSIPLEEVPGLALEHGFKVSGKMSHIDLLSQLGDQTDADYHINHTEVTKENYFILSKSMLDLKNNTTIETVPTIHLRIPEKDLNNLKF